MVATLVVATVTDVSGSVFARAEDGLLRPLKQGDQLLAGEVLVTPEGSYAQLESIEGEAFPAMAVEELQVTPDMLNSHWGDQTDDSVLYQESLQQLVDALNSGLPLDVILSVTAAGGGTGAGDAGHDFVLLERISESIEGSELESAAGLAAASNLPLDEDAGRAADSAEVVDNEPPTLTLSSDDALLSEGESATITFEFSEAVAGFTVDDIQVSGGTLSDLIQVDDHTWTATFSPDAGYEGEASISVADDLYSDLSGNYGSGSRLDLAVDTQGPSLIISSNDALLTEGESATITFEFSEAVMDFTGDDIVVTGGTLSDLVQVDENTWTANFTPDAGYEGGASISVADDLYSDLSGNLGSGSRLDLVVDTQGPSLIISSNDALLTEGESATITFEFSEAVMGFTGDDIVVSGGTLSDLTQVGENTWTGTFTPGAGYEGGASISVADDLYTDLSGHLGSGSHLDLVVDTQGPSVVISAADEVLVSGESTDLLFEFSEPVTEFDLNDIRVAGGSLSNLTQLDNSTWTGTFTPDGSDDPVIEVINDSYTDLAGNQGSGDALDINLAPLVDSAVSLDSMIEDGGVITITQADLLQGASDVDADELTATNLQLTGGEGTLTDLGNGSWAFKPDEHWSGDVSFSFDVSDGVSTTPNTAGLRVIADADTPLLSLGASLPGSGSGDAAELLPSSTGLLFEQFDQLANFGAQDAKDAHALEAVLNGLEADDSSLVTSLGAGNSRDEAIDVPTDSAFSVTGLVYLEAGKSYSFSGHRDDTMHIELGGESIYSVGWDNWGSYETSSFVPEVSGYYELEAYIYNATGIGSFSMEVSVDGGAPASIGSLPIYSEIADVVEGGGRVGSYEDQGDGGFYPAEMGTGFSGSEIPLPKVLAELVDKDGSELLSITVDNLPAGMVLSDGVHSFTGSLDHGEMDISGWDLGNLSLTSVPNYTGSFDLNITATATEQSNTDHAATTISIPVQVLDSSPVVMISAEDNLLSTGESTEITFEFSESVTDLESSDITVSGGAISDLTQVDDDTWTGIFTQQGNEQPAISIKDDSYTDLVGNNGSGGRLELTADTSAPTLEISSDDLLLSEGETATLTFSFSEPVAGFESADIQVIGGQLEAASLVSHDGGQTWTANLTGDVGFEGPISITVADNQYSDLAGNPGSGDRLSLNTDTLGPSVLITAGKTELGFGEATEVLFEFSEAVAGFDGHELVVSGGTISHFSQRDENTWTAIFTQDQPGEPGISVADNVYTDLAGNLGRGDQLALTAKADAPNLSVTEAMGDEDHSIPLNIEVSLVDPNETLTGIVLNGIPDGALLRNSAGDLFEMSGGSINLSLEQLDGLAITPPAQSDQNFTLEVVAASTAANGDMATSTVLLPVEVNAVADLPLLDVSLGEAKATPFIPEPWEFGEVNPGDVVLGTTIDAVVKGSAGQDLLVGERLSGNNEFFDGGAMGDAMHGYDGDDVFIAGAGSDAIYADEVSNLNGFDTVIFSGNYADYLIIPDLHAASPYLNVVDTRGIDSDIHNVNIMDAGDHLYYVEQLVFDDGVYIYDPITGTLSQLMSASFDLNISAALQDSDGSENLQLSVAGLPEGALLSAGTQNPDGSWSLTTDQLAGLQLTVGQDSTDFDLSVTAMVTETPTDVGYELVDDNVSITTETVHVTVPDDLYSSTADLLYGDNANNNLVGGDSIDLIAGGEGEDMLSGELGDDVLSGGQGHDLLIGGEGEDLLVGDDGDDVLVGGMGDDLLIGGLGADTFVWAAGDVGTVGNPAQDIVTDFNPAEGDALDLRDLLVDEQGQDLSQFIHGELQANSEGGIDTVLEISSTGLFDPANDDFSEADMTIRLENIELGDDSAAIIQQLLNNGNLLVDQ